MIDSKIPTNLFRMGGYPPLIAGGRIGIGRSNARRKQGQGTQQCYD